MSKLQEWVHELQNGAYLQGKGHLKEDGQYCCLGVLCDAVLGLPSEETDHGVVGFKREEFDSPTYEYLPYGIAEEYGLANFVTREEAATVNRMVPMEDPVSTIFTREQVLAALNDCGVPFYAIGMVIRLLEWDGGDDA